MDLLERWPTDDDQPWFLWVNFPGPHDPFDPPADRQARYADVDFPGPVNAPASTPPQDHLALRRNYAAACEGIDAWIGRLLAAVDARGETDRTLILFASDHGELLGDHGYWAKNRPEEGSVHVPLILAGPGVPAGAVRHDPVEVIDLSATLLSAAGLPVPDHMDARPLLGADVPRRDVQVSALGEWRMICDGRHKLVLENAGATRRLYDLHDDPGEAHDLAPARPDLADRLAARYARETRGPRP